MRKFFLTISIGFVLVLNIFAATTPTTIKIGVNIGFTGRGEAMPMRQLQQAMTMLQKELNARPNAPYHYELIFEDNGYTPRGSVLATQKLVSVDKVDALISVFDYAIAPTLPIIRSQKIPSLGLGWGVKAADGQYSFIFGCSEVSHARALYQGLKNQPYLNATTIVSVRQVACPILVGEMQRLAKADGKSAFGEVWFNPDEMDFRGTILKIRESGAKRIVLMAFGNEMNAFLYQLSQQADYKPDLWGFGFGFRYANERPHLAGSIIVANAPHAKEFDEMFKNYAKEEPTDWTVGAYDILKLLTEAIEAAPQNNLPMRQKIAEAIRNKQKFNGFTGNYTQEKGTFDAPALLFRLKATGEEPYAP